MQTMHGKWTLAWLVGLIAVVTIFGFGCGGGGNAGPTPPSGTATLTGTVVAADDTQFGLPNAVVTVEDADGQGASTADGSFTISNLPAGTWRVRVDTPDSEDYGSAYVEVALAAQQVTTVSIAVLPLSAGTPQAIVLDPPSVTVDVNSLVPYHAQIVGADSQPMDGLQPSWVVVGGVGTITRAGTFTAQAVGSGHVMAYAGDAQSTGDVVVVGHRPPRVNSFQLTPLVLPASGGEIFVSCALSDGDGIRTSDVTIQVFAPDATVINLSPHVTNPGAAIPVEGVANCYLDASYGVDYQIPANDNQPSAGGVQAAQQYSARVRVRDRTGVTTLSDFIEFSVMGVDAPPSPPPGI